MNTMTINNENESNNNTNYEQEVFSSITRKDFCAIWKKISNDKRVKPTYIDHKSYFYNVPCKLKQKGWIHPEHHIIYNLIRQLPAHRGFKENTQGYQEALTFIKKSYNFNRSTYILSPFEEYIPNEQLTLFLSEIQSFVNKQQ